MPNSTSCRICNGYADPDISVNIFDKKNEHIFIQLQGITGICMENHSCLPDLICQSCQERLREAIVFRDSCICNQQRLLRSLTIDQQNEISDIFKSTINALITAQDPSPRELEEEILAEEQEEFIFADDLLIKEETLQENANYDDLIEVDVNNSNKECNRISSPEVLTSDNYIYNSDDEAAVLDNVLDDEFDTEVISKSPKPKRRTKGPAQRRGNGQGLFFCDQCGNHISGKTAFELHGRRHRGEKHYQCEICQDRFCTTSELNRHMRKHTGERPFACQYCGRRFTDYTTRVKHERTHTNERPYICNTCGKAFTTGYILKNHMLVHSGERAFKCELCEKSFILSTHLNTHYRSTVHKRNMEIHEMMTKSDNKDTFQIM